MIYSEKITAVVGQPVEVDSTGIVTVSLYDTNENELLKIPTNETTTVKVPTSNLAPGNYFVVVKNEHEEPIEIIPVRIRGLFEQESRIETLQEQINLIDKVITAKLSDSDGVLQQLSINNKTLVFSSLGELTLLVDSLRKQLNAEIAKEQRKKGKAPFKQIKLVLTGDKK